MPVLKKITRYPIKGLSGENIEKILLEKEKEISQVWMSSTILPLLWMAMAGGVKKEIKEEILDI